MFRYAAKRTSRNWKLFAAILVGILIASTLFGAANIGANTILFTMLARTLDDVSVDMTYQQWGITQPSSTLEYIQQQIALVPGVSTNEIIIRHENSTYDGWEDWQDFYTVGIQENSSIYEGITHIQGSTSLGINETFITTSSAKITDYPIGSNYSIQIGVERYSDPFLLVNITLKVVGHIELTTRAWNALIPTRGYGPEYEEWLLQHQNLFITDLNQTFFPLVNHISTLDPEWVSSLNSVFLIFLDRATLINPYNLQGSMQNIQQVVYQISNRLSANYPGSIWNILGDALYSFTYIAETHRWTFIQVSLPVFFVALYMGITLNDVTFSLRRREVGLLLSKGSTRSQITSMFLIESILVGLLASGLGLGLAVLIVPFFSGIGTYTLIPLGMIGIDNIFLTVVFGVMLAGVSTYFPARKATRIPTAEALREYTLMGETAGYRKMLAWTCLGLGTYKLVIWILGINLLVIFQNLYFTNPILGMLVLFWGIFDAIIQFWAPLLFFWGFTTILVKGSRRFYDYSERFIRRLLGDLGGIAAHNIRRRPGRTAAIIFLSALLVGYGIQTVGTLASGQDYAIRTIYAEVGGDIRVLVNIPENVTNLLPIIQAIDGVKGATGEYHFTMSALTESTTIRAINVSEWRDVAYFEIAWFPGYPGAQRALQNIANDNRSIILERLVGKRLGLEYEDTISLTLEDTTTTRSSQIAGFFGPEPALVSGVFYSDWMAEETWSYVSIEYMEELAPEVNPTGYILVALDSRTVNTVVVEAIKALPDVINVESAVTILDEFNTDILRNSAANMMRLGVLFAFILASVGTTVVVHLTLRERRESTALMSARGTTYAQTVIMLMAEAFIMMLFAILVGLLVGFIILYGLIQSANSASILGPALVLQRFLPPPFLPAVLLQIGTIVGLLILATMIPILIEARNARYDLSVLR